MMTREVAEAFLAAPPEDRDLAAGEVVEAWLRTFAVRHSPGYQEMVERAATSEVEPSYTVEDLPDRLGL